MKRSSGKIMSGLFRLFQPLRKEMTLSVMISALRSLAFVLVMVFSGYAILQIIGHRKSLSLPLLCAGIILSFILAALLKYTEKNQNRKTVSKTKALLEKQEGSIPHEDVMILKDFPKVVLPFFSAAVPSVIVLILLGRYSILTALLALSSYLVTGIVLPLLAANRHGDIREEIRELVSEAEKEIPEEDALSENDAAQLLFEAREEEAILSGRSRAAASLFSTLFTIMMIIAVIMLYRQGTMNYEGALISVLAFMSSFGPAVKLADAGLALPDILAAGNRVLDALEKEEGHE